MKPVGGAWQFSVRGLLLAMIVMAAVFAIHRVLGPKATLCVLWVGTMVGAHVAANAWGSRTHPARGDSPRPRAEGELPFAPASRLSRPTILGRRIAMTIAASALLGGAAGATALASLVERPMNWTQVALAGLSAAVICGWISFLAASFVSVAREAWREATGRES